MTMQYPHCLPVDLELRIRAIDADDVEWARERLAKRVRKLQSKHDDRGLTLDGVEELGLFSAALTGLELLAELKREGALA